MGGRREKNWNSAINVMQDIHFREDSVLATEKNVMPVDMFTNLLTGSL